MERFQYNPQCDEEYKKPPLISAHRQDLFWMTTFMESSRQRLEAISSKL
jgi:hypothetical protein